MKYSIPWQMGDGVHSLRYLEVDPQRTALLVVDMQNSGQAARQVLPQCRILVEAFRSRGLPIVYTRVGPLLRDGRDMHLKRQIRLLNKGRVSSHGPGRHIPRGFPGHEVLTELAPGAGELVLDKNTSGAFGSAPIDRHLRAFDVQNLVVCGVHTSRCVENTARSAADRGYNVILAVDACSDKSPENHQIAVRNVGHYGGSAKTTAQVISEVLSLLDPVGVG